MTPIPFAVKSEVSRVYHGTGFDSIVYKHHTHSIDDHGTDRVPCPIIHAIADSLVAGKIGDHIAKPAAINDNEKIE